ncbi:MAG TPA: hypothetical protein VFB21_20735 [Chthonomonadaceae bacterium]|nr:hypothetical protein [Chthonomonadaceae bacterium]
MQCNRCGSRLSPSNPVCPVCSQQPIAVSADAPDAPDLEMQKTRYLVPLEQCPRCRFVVFPSQQRCSSCGTLIERPWLKPAWTSTPPTKQELPLLQNRRSLLVGVASLLVMLGGIVGLVYLTSH